MTEFEERRLNGIHKVLTELTDGQVPVYFNPPNKLTYPCILYQVAKQIPTFANDMQHIDRIRYTVTVITINPDSDLPRLVGKISYMAHDNRFIADRLYHDVFTYYD